MTSALAFVPIILYCHFACFMHCPPRPPPPCQVLLNRQWSMWPILQLRIPGLSKWLKLATGLAGQHPIREVFLRIWTETLRQDCYCLGGVGTWSDKVRIGTRVGTWQLEGTLRTFRMENFSEDTGLQRGEWNRETKRWKGERRLLGASPGPVRPVCASWNEDLCSLPGSLLKATEWVSDPYDWIIP